MNENSWFRITPRRERERNEKKYQNKMFPLGEGQREQEIRLLRALLPGRKDGNELLYQLICVKECLQAEEPQWQQEELALWQGNTLLAGFTAGEKAAILALALLEQECTGLLDLPDEEQVRARAKELMEGLE